MLNYISKATIIANECASLLNLTIEEVEWVKEAGTYILRIIADSSDGLDINQATSLNELISDALDKDDFIEEEYMLEVSSPGAEKQLKSEEEIIKSINSYIHIDFKEPIEIIKQTFIKDIEGTLLSVNEEELELSINLKGRIKKVQVLKENIKLIRKAIKF